MQPRRQLITDMFPYRQAADGCPLCVICRAELRRKDGLPRRKDARYCSKTCREDAWVRSGDTSVIRGLLLERDKGFCGSCGLDCAALEAASERCLGYYGRLMDGHLDRELSPTSAALWRGLGRFSRELHAAFIVRLADLGFHSGQHTWEAHHIMPVAKGGGGCGLEGYATLCRHCHKRAGAELAARRSRLPDDEEPVG